MEVIKASLIVGAPRAQFRFLLLENICFKHARWLLNQFDIPSCFYPKLMCNKVSLPKFYIGTEMGWGAFRLKEYQILSSLAFH